MRTLFLLLLLANAMFFAYDRYGNLLFPGESQLLQQQINPRAIRLLGSAPSAKAEPVKREQTVACLEWGAFLDGEKERAEGMLAPLALGTRLTQRRVDETASWWVYMPQQASRQAANSKTSELKRLGVEDFFIVQDDPKFRFAISLGIFRTQEAAKNRLEQLRAKGVRTAQVGAREPSGQRTWYQVRDVPEAIARKLDEFKQATPGSELRECAEDGKKTQ